MHDPRYNVERPCSRESTASLQARVEGNMLDADVLHEVYVELLFRERKTARELRDAVEAQFRRLKDYFDWPTTVASGGSGELVTQYLNIVKVSSGLWATELALLA